MPNIDKHRYQHLQLTKDRKKARNHKMGSLWASSVGDTNFSAESVDSYPQSGSSSKEDYSSLEVSPSKLAVEEIVYSSVNNDYIMCNCCGESGNTMSDAWDNSKLCHECRHSSGECCISCGAWEGDTLCTFCREL
jgi:hypothetical protein